MDGDTMIAIAGLVGLGATALTGALWDSPLVTGHFAGWWSARSHGRHAMRR